MARFTKEEAELELLRRQMLENPSLAKAASELSEGSEEHKELQNKKHDLLMEKMPGYKKLQKFKEGSAFLARQSAGVAAGGLDLVNIVPNLVQMARGKQGYSFQEKAKELVDPNEVGKPTSSLGKGIETATDYFSPFLLANAAKHTGINAGKEATKLLGKSAEPIKKIATAAKETLTKGGKYASLPGKALVRTVDNLVGPAAVRNYFSKPTVGNIAGLGVSKIASSENNDNPLTQLIGGTAANLGVDLVGNILTKGKKTLTKMKLSNPEVQKEVERILADKSLSKLKKQQAIDMLTETKKETSIKNTNKANKDKYDKDIEHSKRADHQATAYEILERLAFEQASKNSLAISPELAKSLNKSSDINAGKSAVKQNKQTNKQMKQEFNELYKVKGELEAKLGTGDVVNLDDVIKYYQEKFGKKASTRAIQNFFSGEEGELIKSVFDVPHSSSTRKSINAVYNPKNKVTLDHASESLDLTTKNNDLLSMNTSGQRGSIKHTGTLIRKAIRKAQKEVAPEELARLDKVDKLYGATSDLRDAASDVGRSRHSPAEAAHKVESSLTADGNAFKMAGTPELVSNILRKAARTKTGKLDSKGLAEKLISMEEATRKMVLDKLPAEQKKEVKRLINNYVKDIEARDARKLAKDSKLPVYKEPIRQPEKLTYVNESAKPYTENKITSLEGYLDTLEPHHRAKVESTPGVTNALKQAELINYEKRASKHIPFVSKPMHALHDLWHGRSMINHAPKVADLIEQEARTPISKFGAVPNFLAKSIPKVDSKLINSASKGSGKESEPRFTREEAIAELKRREMEGG